MITCWRLTPDSVQDEAFGRAGYIAVRPRFTIQIAGGV